MSCPHPEVAANRELEQRALWTALKSLQTPPLILGQIMAGILQTKVPCTSENLKSEPTSSTTSPPSCMSCTSSTPGEAYHHQSQELGWETFLCGKISNRWKECCYEECLSRHQWINKNVWSAGVVKAVLKYSLALWRFRCALLHGRTQAESYLNRLAALREQTTTAYRQFEENPFIIRQDLRHIFLTPLSQRLKHDLDGLHCFLSTYDIGRQDQALSLRRSSEHAKQFFFHRSLPLLVGTSELEVASNLTSSMLDETDNVSLQSYSTSLTGSSYSRSSVTSIGSHRNSNGATHGENSDEDTIGSLDDIIQCNISPPNP